LKQLSPWPQLLAEFDHLHRVLAERLRADFGLRDGVCDFAPQRLIRPNFRCP